jgi:protein SCO1/2
MMDSLETNSQVQNHPLGGVAGGGPSPQYAFWWGLILLLIGGLLGAGLMRALQPTRTIVPKRTGPLQVYGEVSDFTLTERSGDEFSRDDLLGRVWIADFFFTSCAGICPIMSSAMEGIQARLEEVEGVTLVSISVDPERDTPERLRQYAKRYHADETRWWFLTGDKRVIYQLSQDSFRLSVEEAPPDKRGPEIEDVLHSSKFVLLDRQSRIRGYYDGDDKDDIELLIADVQDLLKE